MAARSDKVIITCAVTGSIHTPTMSDALPVTPDQIAGQAIAAAEAGAVGLHSAAMHLDEPPYQRKSDAKPALRSFGGAVGLRE